MFCFRNFLIVFLLWRRFVFVRFLKRVFLAKRCVLEQKGPQFRPPIGYPANRTSSSTYRSLETLHAKQKNHNNRRDDVTDAKSQTIVI